MSLTFAGVGLSYGGEPVLNGIDLTVAPGEFVVLLGPSGCGKTSLLRLAGGALAPSRGEVQNAYARTAAVYQEPRLLRWMTTLDNAAFAMKAAGVRRAERRVRARAILLRLGLAEDDLTKRPPALSGGMAQRVAFARALAVEPDFILMDEPFAALEAGLRRRLQDLARAETERSGAAALFVTHDVTEAVRVASRIVVLSRRPARIVADFANVPARKAAEAFEAAAALLRRPDVAAAINAEGGEEIELAFGSTRPRSQPR
jgi:NitT/TauT family transport system ATP-binding protein